MIFTTPEMLSYYTSSVRIQRRDWFLAALFLFPADREAVIAIYALDIELEHVRHVAKEEMIGHIRYAWWQENIERLHDDSSVRDHPLLQALANIKMPPEFLLGIVSEYADFFPDLPPGIDIVVQNAVREYLYSNEPDSNKQSKKWEKAGAVIASHRNKYGSKGNNWLLVKLLFA